MIDKLTYEMIYICNNCGKRISVNIPKRTLAKCFYKECPNCGRTDLKESKE